MHHVLKAPFSWRITNTLVSLSSPFSSSFKRLCCQHTMTRERKGEWKRPRTAWLDGAGPGVASSGKLELNKHAPHDYYVPEQAWPESASPHSHLITCFVCSCVNKHLLDHESALYDRSNKNNPSALEIKQWSRRGIVLNYESAVDLLCTLERTYCTSVKSAQSPKFTILMTLLFCILVEVITWHRRTFWAQTITWRFEFIPDFEEFAQTKQRNSQKNLL